MIIKKDIETSEDIKVLIDKFYEQIIVDPVIGFIFTDVIELSWEKHIPIMNSFWNSILLGETTYSGNPMIKHIELNKLVPLKKIHFDRWTELWESTVHEYFDGSMADQAVSKAKNIAQIMQRKIGVNN
ncbi:MAG: group III truncated hemoglobin [Ignavibacteria bacterium]